MTRSTTTEGTFCNEVEKEVAFAQLEFLTIRNQGLRSAGSAGMLSIQLDDPTEFPNLNLILRVLQLRWIDQASHSALVHDHDSPTSARKRMLESLSQAIDLATDNELIAVAKAFYAFKTTQDSLSAAKVEILVSKLTDDPLFSSSADMQVVAALIRSKEENLSPEDKDLLLNEASELARQHSLVFYLIRSLNIRSTINRRDVDRMRQLNQISLDAYKKFGSSIDVARNLRSIARFERRNRNYTNALEQLTQAKNLVGFADFPEVEKSRILRDLANVKQKVATDDSTPENLTIHDLAWQKELSRLQRKSDLMAVKAMQKNIANHDGLKREESKSKRLLEETNELTSRLSNSQDAQSRYLFVSIASLLALLVVAGAYRFRVLQLALRAELAEQNASLVEEKNKVLALETKVQRLKTNESLGLMAGGIAHDFNNLLQGVSGNVELIKKSLERNDNLPLEESSEQKERVNAISDATSRAQQLAQKMLDYSGKRHSAKTTFDLNQFISDELALVRSTSIHHKFSVEKNCEPLIVHGDAMQFLQVLLNFVTNAVEASEPGSEITIGASKESVVDGQCLSLFGSRDLGGDFCVLEVKDQGSGIAPAQVARTFAPYFSTKQNSNRGLGLTTAYGVAEAHDGWIRCRPNDGPGTTFQLLVPAVQIDTLPESMSAKVPLDDIGAASPDCLLEKRILIVDDQPIVLETCQRMAESLGLHVTTADSGTKALEILDAQANPNAFDCILMDVVMPQMGAGELLAELQTRNQQSPVLIMSGFSHQRLETFRELSLVIEIIPKPFRLKQLKRVLTRHFNVTEASQDQIANKPSPPHYKANNAENKTRDANHS